MFNFFLHNRMETTLKDRLNAFISYKGLSQYRFQKVIGVANGYVNGVKNSIHMSIVDRIKSNYPELNIDWLLYGKGDMINSGKVQTEVVNAQNTIIDSNNSGIINQGSDNNNTSEVNKLLKQILAMKSKVIKARLCPSHEDCIKILDELLNEE